MHLGTPEVITPGTPGILQAAQQWPWIIFTLYDKARTESLPGYQPWESTWRSPFEADGLNEFLEGGSKPFKVSIWKVPIISISFLVLLHPVEMLSKSRVQRPVEQPIHCAKDPNKRTCPALTLPNHPTLTDSHRGQGDKCRLYRFIFPIPMRHTRAALFWAAPWTRPLSSFTSETAKVLEEDWTRLAPAPCLW